MLKIEPRSKGLVIKTGASLYREFHAFSQRTGMSMSRIAHEGLYEIARATRSHALAELLRKEIFRCSPAPADTGDSTRRTVFYMALTPSVMENLAKLCGQKRKSKTRILYEGMLHVARKHDAKSLAEELNAAIGACRSVA